jgi:hypothetical protein
MNSLNHLDAATRIVIKGLPELCTESELSEHLWKTIGLDIPATDMSIGETNRMAIVGFSRDALAAFIGRYLEGSLMSGNALTIEAMTPRRKKTER